MGVGAVAVEELHPPHLGAHRPELLAGPEGAVDHRAVAGPPQLGPHERAALAGLDVLELEDLEDRSLDVDVVAVAELIGRIMQRASVEAPLLDDQQALGDRGQDLGRPSLTTTRSSIRIPKRPGRYTPGSTVTTLPVRSSSSERCESRGPSWMSSPTPWPRPWPKCSPCPRLDYHLARGGVGLPAAPPA